MTASRTGKYVVLHKGVGRLHEGRVFTVDDLPPYCDMQRLLDLRAIRHATEEEACLEQVTIEHKPDTHRSIETIMFEQDRMIEDQKAKIRSLLAEKAELERRK
jgi:hypothetical protein